MAETYCGKLCENCKQKEQLNCPGCRLGPGRQVTGDCQIARCCRSKNHETCRSCSSQGYCDLKKNNGVEYRLQQKAVQEERRAALGDHAAVMGKWMRLLVLLIIPDLLSMVLTSSLVTSVFPVLQTVGQVLSMAAGLAYGGILLRLGSQNRHYRIAGILSLSGAVAAVLIFFLPAALGTAILALLLSMALLAVDMAAQLQELDAHAEAVRELDPDLCAKWLDLRKWTLIVYVGLLGSSLFALVPLLGLLVLLMATVGVIVIAWRKLDCLFKTEKLFVNYRN
ncbi:MAG: DUF3795 domain-containing protein [Clostridia bacterium]|nr:DUF3795 domain-containing protein [Clostridia bacterium]MBQ8893181.1 DUF3795 domain-containing protein [Clostridia bacterium]